MSTPATPTHYFHATLLDANGQPVGIQNFLLNMVFDQARDAFVNAETISLTVEKSAQVTDTLALMGEGKELFRIALEQRMSLCYGDTVTFEQAAIQISIPHGTHLSFPGLHVIEEEPSLYD